MGPRGASLWRGSLDTLGGMDPGRLGAQIRALSGTAIGGDPSARHELSELLGRHNPIDLARTLPDLEQEEITLCFDLVETETQGVVLTEAAPKEQALLMLHVGDHGSEVIATMDPDDAADVLESVEPSDAEALLRDLDTEDAREIRELREYGPDTAGGLMTPEVLTIPSGARPVDIFEVVRGSPDAETINALFVCDADVLRGVVSIRDVIVAQPDEPVSQWMTSEVIRVAPEVDQEEVIRMMETYHLGVLPVVDRTGRLLGVVTADDALTALEDEADEDVLAMAGAGQSLPTERGVLERVRARMPYLLFTLFGCVGAGWIIRSLAEGFGAGGMIEKTAQLLPLVAGLAGNVGMQSAAVMLRGFATGEIPRSRVRRVIAEEILVAFANGVICGLISGLMALVIMTDPEPERFWAVAVSVALAASAAGTIGAVLPSACQRVNIDPALAAGPVITTLNDILGFTIYICIVFGVFELAT
ncbi:MAG: magnesium transporter [Planctomycetes bacterium]|nr:magnesium transporter [Planctomycetota bacterium]